MKNKIKIILLIALFGELTGCEIDNTNNDVQPWQKDMVEDLTAKEWIRNYHVVLPDQEYDEQEIIKLNKDATGYWKTITSCKDQAPIENAGYLKWTFTTPAYEYIYMNRPTYWEIKEFTSKKLCVYETYEDPVKVPDQTVREYKEYTAKE